MKNHLEKKFPLYLKHAQQRDAGTGELKLRSYPLVYNQGPAEAFWSLPREHWEWAKHLGVMAPMADHVWMESQPEVSLSRVLTQIPEHRIKAMEAQRRMEQGTSYVENARRKIATHLTLKNAQDLLRESRSSYESSRRSGFGLPARQALKALEAKERQLQNIKWVYEIRTFVETAKGSSRETFPIVKVMVDEMGGFVRRTPEPDAPMFERPDADSFALHNSSSDPAVDFRQFAVDAAFVAMYTLSLANCRNISLDEYTDRVGNRHLRKELGNDGEKTHKYSVVNMHRTSTNGVSEPGESTHGRLHFVRGHFKTYTSQNPLMGRHIGTYFWSHHARGDTTAGEVTAHYEI